jgi:UTP-glucose-1-phosphate uridylyltransferase/mevalonate kinase
MSADGSRATDALSLEIRSAALTIFVPGRICLFGEHSDWAGGYRRINGEIEKGYAIVVGTNQGVHAEVKPHPTKLIMTSTLPDGSRMGPYEIPMEVDALLAEAEKGGFFSYAAGVAHQVLTHYRVGGMVIDNTLTDLPVKKGLSSSAALCVLVARAFNRLYDLKMTIRGEMEYAYVGEITTPSRCGRMDQGCAYGNRPIIMSFDGERIDVRELNVPKDLHFVIVDLCAGKDTKKILNDLNHAYPFADGKIQEGVQEYLGPINTRILQEAAAAIREGDAERIGALMVEAQGKFDEYLIPACPEELTAPKLHETLNHPAVQPHIYGGKGVGSQGDGTAQFIAKDLESQEKVVEILERDLGVQCLKLTIPAGRKVRKALIPAAGFGTRMFPASKAIKKELFPVIGSDGRAKPVIMAIVEEAVSAGIDEVAIIVQAQDEPIFREFFTTPPRVENWNKLSQEDQAYWRYVSDLGSRITFLKQEVQEGFGHAVYCAKDWIDNEPFLLMLGDHLYASDTDVPCARQVMEVYECTGRSALGLMVTPGEQLRHFGCATGVWKEEGAALAITQFAEKPDVEYAREHLHITGMGDNNYLTVFGQYVLKPEIFTYLEEAIEHNMREGGEFQLTSCLDKLRQDDGFVGVLIKGRRFDIGIPEAYRQTMQDFRDA